MRNPISFVRLPPTVQQPKIPSDAALLQLSGSEFEQYLGAEEGFFNQLAAESAQRRSQLRDELLRARETSLHSQPSPLTVGSYTYDAILEPGNATRTYRRWRVSDPNPRPTTILAGGNPNLNAVAPEVTAFRPSPREGWIAYTLNSGGPATRSADAEGRGALVVVAPEASCALLVESKGVFDAAWAPSEGSLFYTVGEGLRPQRLMAVSIPSDPLHNCPSGELKKYQLFHETNGASVLSLRRGLAQGRVFLLAATPSTTDGYELTELPLGLRRLTPEVPGVSYEPIEAREEVLLRTYKLGAGARIVAAADTRQVVYEAPEGTSIDDAIAMDRGLVLVQRRQGNPEVLVRHRGEYPQEHLIKFEGPAGQLTLLPPTTPAATSVRVQLTSPRLPPTVIEIDLQRGSVNQISQESVRGFRPEELEHLLLYAKSRDETLIPFSLVRARDHPRAPMPLLLQVYGAYGSNDDLRFRSEYVPLLRRGVQIAVAHVRGGGFLGPEWHWTGAGEHKHRSVEDLIAVAHDLVAQGFSQPTGIVLHGRSAGALVVASAIMQEPTLASGAVLEAPFLDPLFEYDARNDQLKEREEAEWGSRRDSDGVTRIKKYAPLHLSVPADLPPLLVQASVVDEVTPPAAALAWVRRLRAAAPSTPIAVSLGRRTPHSGPSSAEETAEVELERLDFMCAVWGFFR